MISDKDIFERIMDGSIIIRPFEADNVEPVSVDLRLGDEFKRVERRYLRGERSVLDLDNPDPHTLMYTDREDSIVIHPGDFVLATTKERVALPDDLKAEVRGRSSLGRVGVSVHQTAGLIDPGFDGQITLELCNHGPTPVRVHSDQRICQIVFSELSSSADHPYGHKRSQYQHQSGATPSGMDFD